ncbi:MAG: AAA-type ATPase lid domain-containing protein, partial [Methylophilaceae bacterium]
NVFRLDLPPLRERGSDIALLAAHFLKRRNLILSDAAMLALQSYPWPGNVRELENVLERAAIVCGGQPISPQHLPADMLANTGLAQANITTATTQQVQADALESNVLSMPIAVETLERQLIDAALAQCNGNKSRAAKLLEISERSLWYKLSQYKLK